MWIVVLLVCMNGLMVCLWVIVVGSVGMLCVCSVCVLLCYVVSVVLFGLYVSVKWMFDSVYLCV